MDYFKPSMSGGHTQKRLVDSNLSWHCADASLFLDKVHEPGGNQRIKRMLLGYFGNWCECSSGPSKPRKNRNESDLRGYFELQYLSGALEASNPLMRELRDSFFNFLKDINLYFSREEGNMHNIQYNVSSQRDAFRRFSGNLEKSARKFRPSLCDQFERLGLNNPE